METAYHRMNKKLDQNFDSLNIKSMTLNASPSPSVFRVKACSPAAQGTTVQSTDARNEKKSDCRCRKAVRHASNPTTKDHIYHFDRPAAKARKYPFEEIFKNERPSPNKAKKISADKGKYNQDLLVVKSFTRTEISAAKKSSMKKVIKLTNKPDDSALHESPGSGEEVSPDRLNELA